ncbi:MAG TPA: endonuclease III [Methanospirillum sp.]|uniref:endonuclease III n=1 Tax=Methanospirillum sp. TaxID=45200 RepID=UPI002C88EF79|nr:endonuclease III [Methanospirillum sp.]HWQ63765.1 endonuclease III [Methanospirillum sp.]
MSSSVPCTIYRLLTKEYDLTSSEGEFLHFENPYQILIATILSAQTTDKTVNLVTKDLFARYPDPVSLSTAYQQDVEKIVHRTGFYRAKSRNIIAAAQVLVNSFNGEVPDEISKLITLPGVGRKTANIVVHHAFGRADGIAVDTHVGRLSGRLGLSDQSDPDRIEQDLLKFFPKEVWGDINGLFILHGRKVCQARTPSCNSCVLSSLCRFVALNILQ